MATKVELWYNSKVCAACCALTLNSTQFFNLQLENQSTIGPPQNLYETKVI